MPYIQLDTTRIHYETVGKGTPVVLLHGLGGSLNDWYFNTDYLSEHYQLIMFDIPGFGNSDLIDNYTLPQVAQQIVRAIQHLNLSSVDIVGLSLGGAIAMDIGVNQHTYGLTVNSIVVFNSQPAYKLIGAKAYFEYYLRVCLIKMIGLPALSNTIAKRLFPKPGQEALRQYAQSHLRQNSSEAYLAVIKALTQWDISIPLQSLASPLLVVASDGDYPSLDSKGYVTDTPSARLHLVENCGHAIPIEQPQQSADIIKQFLKAQ